MAPLPLETVVQIMAMLPRADSRAFVQVKVWLNAKTADQIIHQNPSTITLCWSCDQTVITYSKEGFARPYYVRCSCPEGHGPVPMVGTMRVRKRDPRFVICRYNSF